MSQVEDSLPALAKTTVQKWVPYLQREGAPEKGQD